MNILVFESIVWDISAHWCSQLFFHSWLPICHELKPCFNQMVGDSIFNLQCLIMCLCVLVFVLLSSCCIFLIGDRLRGGAMRGLDNDYVILGPMRVLQINIMGRGRSQSETDMATTRLTQPRGPSQWKWQHWCNLNLHDS